MVAAALLVSGLAAALPASRTSAEPIASQVVETAPPLAFTIFLDRLMVAESGGRRDAKNPRSTALGPFQFINRTFLDVARRHFASEIAGLTETKILGLRTDPKLSRRAAAVYCEESASYLKSKGFQPTFAHLRLAFLLVSSDAARIIQAQQKTPVVRVLSPAVVKANPFMRNMSVSDLIAKSERDVSTRG
jgi:hypothetical protein